MDNLRTTGLAHIYLDENINGFSNVAIGTLIRAVGSGLKVAYIDCAGTSKKFINFLENISISYSFVKKFPKFHIETFVLDKDKVQRGVLPLVEYFSIDNDSFWNSFGNYDLVIFDSANFENMNKYKIINFLGTRSIQTEIIFVFSNKKDFEVINEHFDLVSKFDYKQEKKIKKNLKKKEEFEVSVNSKIFNITGNGKGKSTYSFGQIIRNFINKKNVKLIYFDKGGNFYGERVFFLALKKWSKENTIYGTLDFAVTGMQRFDGQSFRFQNIEEDFIEAKNGLMLLETASKKEGTLVVADELNTTVGLKLISIEDVVNVLKQAKSEILITGRYSPKEIMDLSKYLIEVVEIKHYSKKGYKVRKGIDF